MAAYKVMIVDDEAFTRVRLQELIPWAEYGLEVTAVAEDARQALDGFDACLPDIVISDIRMPGMTGLEMISECMRRSPHTRFIILSGYGEFGFAQKAIRLGVTDYLLKPTEPEQLLHALVKITDQFNQNRKSRKQQEKLRQYMTDIRSQYILELLAGIQPGYGWDEDADFIGLNWLSQGGFRLTLISVSHAILYRKRSEVELASFAIQNVMAETIEDDPASALIPIRQGQWALVIRDGGDPKRFVSKLYDNLMMHTKIPVHMIVSSPGVHYSEVGTLFWELEKTAEFYGQSDEQPIRFMDEMDKGMAYERWMEPIRELSDWIARGAAEPVEQFLKQMEPAFASWDIGSAKRWCLEWLISLQQPLTESDAAHQVTDDRCDELRVQITAQTDTAALFQFFCKQIYMLLKLRGDDKPHHLVMKAMDMIRESYSRDDIQLSVIAERLGVSTVYLSELFKKETGKTYRNFLLQLRMESAAHLLKDPVWKVYEVAYKVGYNKVEHFVKLFKNYYGMTPSEYRGAIV